MTRKELADEVERLRGWIMGLRRVTPHKTVKDSATQILGDG